MPNAKESDIRKAMPTESGRPDTIQIRLPDNYTCDYSKGVITIREIRKCGRVLWRRKN